MSSIDGFDSPSPKPSDQLESKTPEIALLEAMEACKISVEAAKSPFARASKELLQKYLTDPPTISYAPREIRRGFSEGLVLKEHEIVLTNHNTVTLALVAEDMPAIHRRLLNELHWFCEEIRKRAQRQVVTVLDGLQVDIRRVHETHFTFSWKLRYVVHENDH